MKILTIVGARPQFIKAAVVSRAIESHNQSLGAGGKPIEEIVVHTGQHYDYGMSGVFFKELEMTEPRYHLDVGSGAHGDMTGRMLMKVEQKIAIEAPDVVMVYGDTNSTLAGALAAAKMNLPVAHVEAGMRSFNRRMPEEINRVITDHISDILFCTGSNAVDNLRREGIIHYTAGDSLGKGDSRMVARIVQTVGDVMFDAILFSKQLACKPAFKAPSSFILATLHRAENTDYPERLASIFDAFHRISQEVPIVLPLHPRTRKNLNRIEKKPMGIDSKIVDPVSYREMIYLMEKSELVITDSGGMQKEAFFLKKPCVTLRDETEWVELVEMGVNRLCGADTEEIIAAVGAMRKKKIEKDANVYGSGDAGEKIVRRLSSL
jgi:UDP-GlcNAc3NAcA epimerase